MEERVADRPRWSSRKDRRVLPDHFTIDIELTNRCNADCYFCPRAATPDQGLMSPETFAAALDRADEFRTVAAERTGHDVRVSLCGLGEPLLNRHAAEFVAAVRARDFYCTISSNGSLLDERRSNAILDAGLQRIDINVGEMGDEYEAIYKLPWERTLANVLRFHDLAAGRCDVDIVLVDHRNDPEHIATMRAYWQGHGFDSFFPIPLINRGGSLPVEHMRFEHNPEPALATEMFEAAGGVPECQWPFTSQFIGFDGNYYLCCSDWEKKVPVGSVHENSLVDVIGPKLDYTRERGPVCAACNVDPINFVADRIRAVNAGENVMFSPEWQVDELLADQAGGIALLDQLAPGVSARAPGRRRIPVRAL
jgi:MoaA/NifB/PqqE/SkfB family radical SAM enzyme